MIESMLTGAPVAAPPDLRARYAEELAPYTAPRLSYLPGSRRTSCSGRARRRTRRRRPISVSDRFWRAQFSVAYCRQVSADLQLESDPPTPPVQVPPVPDGAARCAGAGRARARRVPEAATARPDRCCRDPGEPAHSTGTSPGGSCPARSRPRRRRSHSTSGSAPGRPDRRAASTPPATCRWSRRPRPRCRGSGGGAGSGTGVGAGLRSSQKP